MVEYNIVAATRVGSSYPWLPAVRSVAVELYLRAKGSIVEVCVEKDSRTDALVNNVGNRGEVYYMNSRMVGVGMNYIRAEDIKILVKLLPIAACTIIVAAISTEFLSVSLQQASTMDTHIRGIKIPVTNFPIFLAFLNIFFLLFYYFIFSCYHLSTLCRIGIGLIASIHSLGSVGILEIKRRNYAVRNGYQYKYLTPMPNFSAYWLIIPISFSSLAEVCCLIVGLPKLICEEVPNLKGMSDIYGALVGLVGGIVSISTNYLITVISQKNDISWLDANINVGRYDYLYLVYSILSIINLLVFMYLAKKYRYRARLGST